MAYRRGGNGSPGAVVQRGDDSGSPVRTRSAGWASGNQDGHHDDTTDDERVSESVEEVRREEEEGPDLDEQGSTECRGHPVGSGPPADQDGDRGGKNEDVDPHGVQRPTMGAVAIDGEGLEILLTGVLEGGRDRRQLVGPRGLENPCGRSCDRQLGPE